MRAAGLRDLCRHDPDARLEIDVVPAHQRRLGAPLAEQEKHLEVRAERPSGIANGFPEDRDFPIGERAPRPVQTLRTSPAFPTPPGERGLADQPRLGGPSEGYRSD
jgi:hypothetical protein